MKSLAKGMLAAVSAALLLASCTNGQDDSASQLGSTPEAVAEFLECEDGQAIGAAQSWLDSSKLPYESRSCSIDGQSIEILGFKNQQDREEWLNTTSRIANDPEDFQTMPQFFPAGDRIVAIIPVGVIPVLQPKLDELNTSTSTRLT